MDEQKTVEIDKNLLKDMLKKRKAKMKMSLSVCAHCTLCADSCFLYNINNNDPKYMPSYKFINSVGRIYKKKGRLNQKALEDIREIVWKNCVLCTRCYCPFGIDIPDMIAFARSICRSQGVYPSFEE